MARAQVTTAPAMPTPAAAAGREGGGRTGPMQDGTPDSAPDAASGHPTRDTGMGKEPDFAWVRDALLRVLRSEEAVVAPSGWRLARIGAGLYCLPPGSDEPVELTAPAWWPRVAAHLLELVERELPARPPDQ